MEIVYLDETPSLAHHGIKGQKWGIRRFQNLDGSWTEAGRKRYYKSIVSNKDRRYTTTQSPYGTNEMQQKIFLNIEQLNDYEDVVEFNKSIKYRDNLKNQSDEQHRKYAREFVNDVEKGVHHKYVDKTIAADTELLELVAMEISDGFDPTSGDEAYFVRSYTRAKHGNNNPLEKAWVEYMNAYEQVESQKRRLIRTACDKVLEDLGKRKVHEDFHDTNLRLDETYLDTVSEGVRQYIEDEHRFGQYFIDKYMPK